jgi:hypothetical protein
MNAQSIHEINISWPSFLCLIIRPIHYLLFLLVTSIVPVVIGLLIWRVTKRQPVTPIEIVCAALGPCVVVYTFRRLSTLRRAAPWQLIVLASASAAAFAYAYNSFSRMPQSDADLPGVSEAFFFLAIAGVLLPIQSALQWRLQQTRVGVAGTTIGSVIARPSSAAKRAKGIRYFKGCLFAAFGVIFLAVQTLADVTAAIVDREYNHSVFFLIGLALLLRSRRYFQADADSLLAVDRRPPILLLRSFADDAKGGWRLMLSLILSFSRLLDYSLELRLANYFMHFGPFVAIGMPDERLPQIGAARKSFGEGEWQAAVLAWAKNSQLISLFMGSTSWVNWEISQVISLNLTDRLILLMPESHTWLRWRYSPAAQKRLAMLMQVAASTPWREPINLIGSAANIRAIVLRSDGRIIVIRSNVRIRDSYHLAALIAHRLILQGTEMHPAMGGSGHVPHADGP